MSREAAANTVAGDMNRWPDDCRLVIANEIGGERPWHGDLALVAHGAVDVAQFQRESRDFFLVYQGDDVIGNRHAGSPRWRVLRTGR